MNITTQTNNTITQNNINLIKKQQEKEKEAENDMIINFFNETTEHSNNHLDTIRMTTLYNLYEKWCIKNYPEYFIPANSYFTKKIKELNKVQYKSSIHNLNSTSGITHRKLNNFF